MPTAKKHPQKTKASIGVVSRASICFIWAPPSMETENQALGAQATNQHQLHALCYLIGSCLFRYWGNSFHFVRDYILVCVCVFSEDVRMQQKCWRGFLFVVWYRIGEFWYHSMYIGFSLKLVNLVFTYLY